MFKSNTRLSSYFIGVAAFGNGIGENAEVTGWWVGGWGLEEVCIEGLLSSYIVPIVYPLLYTCILVNIAMY